MNFSLSSSLSFDLIRLLSVNQSLHSLHSHSKMRVREQPISSPLTLHLYFPLLRREARRECEEVRGQSEASLNQLQGGLAASRQAQQQQAERHSQDEALMRERR